VLARRVISKNSGGQTFVQKLRHDKRIQPTILPVVETFLLNSFSERSAIAVRLQLPRKKTPNPADKHVGSRMRMRRIALAMSQEKLGAALGLTFQQVQKYERGATRIAASRLQQISHILQVPVEFFFEGAPNASAPHGSNGSTSSMAEINDFISDSDGLRLIRAFMPN
jgi:transcriptional regulator with XRE-family HTH domain